MTTTPAPQLVHGDVSDELLVRLLDCDRVAWDIETSGLDWRGGSIGTCQLHAPELGTFVVHSLSMPPANLMRLLASGEVTKVFHYAPFDLRWMSGHWRVSPAAIECTKLASRLLDPTEDSAAHSLKHLLQINLDVEIDKGQRLTDWLSTDLTSAQLAYAAADVDHLLPLLDSLHKQLADGGLLDLYRRCADFLPTRVQLEVGDWPDVFRY